MTPSPLIFFGPGGAPPSNNYCHNKDNSNDSSNSNSNFSNLDSLIKTRFEACRQADGILRNDPLEPNVQRRKLSGRLQLLAEYEPTLFAHKRPATFLTTTNNNNNNDEDGKPIIQNNNNKKKTPINTIIDMAAPFDATKFHFNKVPTEEVLVQIQVMGQQLKNIDEENDDDSSNRKNNNIDMEQETHNILVNVSPLMFGHGLLIPFPDNCLPQQLTFDSIGLALQLLLINDNNNDKINEFCVGFNSLAAFSSVNHLHLHLLYPGELDHDARAGDEKLMNGSIHFPIASAPVKEVIMNSNYYYKKAPLPSTTDHQWNCQVDLLDWMVPCFSFCMVNNRMDNTCINNNNHHVMESTSTTTRMMLQSAIFCFVQFLHQHRIPHNVLFLRDDNNNNKQSSCHCLRAIVIPRQPQHVFDSSQHGFNAALGEICGMLIAKTQHHFDAFNEDDICQIMKQYVACEEHVLEQIITELQQYQ